MDNCVYLKLAAYGKEDLRIRSANAFKTIDQVDMRILGSIELAMRRYELVPFDEVLKATKLREDVLNLRLSSLLRKKLATSRRGPYRGFSLTEAGYDCLAFHALVKQNVLEAIGPPVGVGKESAKH